MILLLSAAFGLILGIACGGSLQRMRWYPLRGLVLPVLAYVLKAGAAWLLTPQTGAVAVCVIQYALLFGFLAFNRSRPAWPIFVFLGSLGNFLVILFNGGCMPVSAALLDVSSDRLTQLAQNRIYAYTLMTKQTRLPLLGDILQLGSAGMPFGFASIGDLVLCIGIAILFFQLVRAKQTTQPSA